MCSVCGLDLGPRDIPAGTVTHGYCPDHAAELLAEIIADLPDVNGEESRPGEIKQRIERIRSILGQCQLHPLKSRGPPPG